MIAPMPSSPLLVARLVLVALGGMAGAAACAHAPTPAMPPAAAAVLAARFPALRVLAYSVGALHADGARDVAAVLGRGERGARIVAVLWNEGAAGYHFANASGDIDAGCTACDVAVHIRDRVLDVSASDPGPELATVRSFRFVYRGTRGTVLRLVEIRTERITHDAGDRDIDCVVSANLLTGDKVDRVEETAHGTTKRREIRSRVPLRQPLLFDQFAFDLRAGAPETLAELACELGKR